MGVEIERKFLLAGEGWRQAVARSLHIRQGYLGGERCSVRVRIDDDRATLNIKSCRLGAVRSEFEYEIPHADAEELLALAAGPVLAKRRHLVEHAGMLWEIDEFEGDNAGLIVAEIELDDVDAAFERPGWLGAEVTDDPRYYNVNLVREPYSRWSEPRC